MCIRDRLHSELTSWNIWLKNLAYLFRQVYFHPVYLSQCHTLAYEIKKKYYHFYCHVSVSSWVVLILPWWILVLPVSSLIFTISLFYFSSFLCKKPISLLYVISRLPCRSFLLSLNELRYIYFKNYFLVIISPLLSNNYNSLSCKDTLQVYTLYVLHTLNSSDD